MSMHRPKADTGGQDTECSTAVSKDDADGKTTMLRSTDEGKGKDDEAPNKRGRGKLGVSEITRLGMKMMRPRTNGGGASWGSRR